MRGKLYIDGQFVSSSSLEPFEVIDPFDGTAIGTQERASEEDVLQAIASSVEAQKTWKKTTAYERARLLEKWADLLEKNTEHIARVLTSEQGKPLTEARGEVAYGLSYVKWYAQEALRICGDLPASHNQSLRLFVHKEPVGPVAIITPWNFPMAMFVRKLAPALAAGCTAIVKPASATPHTAVAVFELLDEAGFPPGVVSLLTGDAGTIAGPLLASPDIRKLSFTGSTKVGMQLMKESAATLKKLSLELGGHAPLLVFDDADLKEAVEGTLAAKFRNCGQVCIAANRAYVQEGILEDYLKALLPAVKALRGGHGFEEVDYGPLIDRAAFDKVSDHVQDALDKGATLLCGGPPTPSEGQEASTFFPPTVLVGVTEEMKISQEETFGPVLPITVVASEKEAIQKANNTPYGLAAYFFASDHSRITRVEETLEYGMIGVNTGRISAAQAPFGGIKMSGFGREGGPYGIEEYLVTKYIARQVKTHV